MATVCSGFGAQENKICHCFHFIPFYLPWSGGTGAMILIFWMLNLRQLFLSLLSLLSRASLVPLHFLSLEWSVQFSHTVTSDSLWPHDCSTPGFPVHHQLQELYQTHVQGVCAVIQPSHPLSSLSPPTFNLSQHQGLSHWVSSLHQVAKVLEWYHLYIWGCWYFSQQSWFSLWFIQPSISHDVICI